MTYSQVGINLLNIHRDYPIWTLKRNRGCSPHQSPEPLPPGDGNPSLTVGARMESLDWPAVGRISHFQVAHSATGGEGGTGGPRGHPGLSYCQTPAFLKSPAFT